MTRIRRSSRRPARASSASARPRSASSERSWNSSNRMAPTPVSSGSARIRRVKTPSVTTSIRVRGPTRVSRRARKPTRSPTFSPRSVDMRSAAALAARRRGSNTRILRSASHGAPSSASGTRVVLPAPGGATSTAEVPPERAAVISGSTSSIGRSVTRGIGSFAEYEPHSAGAGDAAACSRRRARRPRRHSVSLRMTI